MQTQSVEQKILELPQTERRVLDQLGVGNSFKDISKYPLQISKRLKSLQRKGLAYQYEGEWHMHDFVHLEWCKVCSEPVVVNPSGRSDFWLVVRFPDGSWSTGGKPSDPVYDDADLYWVRETSRERAVPKAQAWRSRERGLINKEFGGSTGD